MSSFSSNHSLLQKNLMIGLFTTLLFANRTLCGDNSDLPSMKNDVATERTIMEREDTQEEKKEDQRNHIKKKLKSQTPQEKIHWSNKDYVSINEFLCAKIFVSSSRQIPSDTNSIITAPQFAAMPTWWEHPKIYIFFYSLPGNIEYWVLF